MSEWVTNAVTRTLEEADLERRFLELCDDVKATPAEERRAKASFDRVAKRAKAPAKSATGRGQTAA